MATRIAFSTHYPDRMGKMAGEPTYFVEKIWSGLEYENHKVKYVLYNHFKRMCKIKTGVKWDDEYPNTKWVYPPKKTTIRSNYEYWKSKEGQLLQPFFWAGKPYRSKHVVFCPEVRLAKVSEIELFPEYWGIILCGQDLPEDSNGYYEFVSDEGFDHPDHFWMWFNSDFDGALLELESVEI